MIKVFKASVNNSGVKDDIKQEVKKKHKTLGVNHGNINIFCSLIRGSNLLPGGSHLLQDLPEILMTVVTTPVEGTLF